MNIQNKIIRLQLLAQIRRICYIFPVLKHEALRHICIVSMITSKGAHGVPGSAIVILAATLSAIPAIPMIGLVLILSVDWFVGIARAVTNIIGNCVATVVIAKWEGDMDLKRAREVLANKQEAEKILIKSVAH